jgi:hypothetical protein
VIENKVKLRTGEGIGKEMEILSPTEGDILKEMMQNFIFTVNFLLW